MTVEVTGCLRLPVTLTIKTGDYRAGLPCTKAGRTQPVD